MGTIFEQHQGLHNLISWKVPSRLAETLECKASGWPILYLGLPLGGNPRAGGFWDPVIERISRRLDGWQKAYLSFGERITLIQSCLTHMPCYFLSLFKLPASVAAKIERLQRDFLWSGIGEGKRDHLVRWDVVCKPKEIGGLGFGNISLRNLALLGKWLWRYPREGSALWHQVILSIYGSHSNGWDANTLVRWSHCCPWKAITQVFQEFSSFTRFVVGNGERIQFWEDLWWGDQPLGTQYPRLFRVVLDKNIPISSVLGPTRPFSWNLNFHRNLSDFEIEDLEGLMRSLDGLHLSPSVFPSKFVWNSQVPFKVQSFVWLVAHKKHGESADHIFLHCSLTIGLWHRGIALWQAASIALIRIVWWERNARIFEDKARNSEYLWDSIVFLASLWVYCSKVFKGTPLIYKRKSIKELHKMLHKCNEQLQQFSHVNKKALDQYINFTEQREELQKRQAELDAGDEKIRELISVLDQRKDESIERTFKGVARHFREVFSELVQGGHGFLVMMKKKDGDHGDDDHDEDGPREADMEGRVEKYIGVKVKASFFYWARGDTVNEAIVRGSKNSSSPDTNLCHTTM
ncbi:Structural maintenance of chromosomes protein 3 [Vitis vinifera]|uniref:Structural maintenance of chromosomes protein 3 n=1 Tax=Vitis vinifera TaxID=29760 RepID=A0A438HIB6_VITVI|nr:Structural maintenance of chromosomes protein 3 [Vitis vinifera]